VSEIRSYRRVFDLERRIYSIDRLRLNPAGIPVRGAVYFLAVVLAAIAASGLPLAGLVLRTIPWYLRDVAVPALVAMVLGAIRIEGRAFHLAARGLAASWLSQRGQRVLSPCGPGCRWHMDDVTLVPDGSDARMRRLRYSGPGAVLVSIAHDRRGRARERNRRGMARRGARALTLGEAEAAAPLARHQVIWMRRGAYVRVRRARVTRRLS
jgi:hypothetical protein